MPKITKCHECEGLNGHHWNGCRTRGYFAVGPHSAAPDTQRAPSNESLEMCCGGTCVRALCPYHGLSAAARRLTPIELACAEQDFAEEMYREAYGRIPPDLRLLGPDDPEVSSDLIYATPDGGVVAVPADPCNVSVSNIALGGLL
jgi:hypothetical protein